MKIEWDQERNIIKVGSVEFNKYTNFRNASAFAFAICTASGIDVQHLKTRYVEGPGIFDGHTVKSKIGHRERNKELGDIFGCSISQLFRHFDKLQKKAFLVPVFDIYNAVKDWKKHGCKLDSTLLESINKNKQMLLEVKQDGLRNLLPICHTLEKSPQELRKEYGKKWKVAANNSLHRNKVIAKHLRGSKVSEYIGTKAPTTLLKNVGWYGEEILTYLSNNFKGKWSKTAEMDREARLYVDTKRMAEKLDEKMNSSWSPRRLKEEHDRMAKEINAQKYSPDPMPVLQEVEPKVFVHGECTATLLDSARLIADEGTIMGHCVGLYADDVRRGRYLVYSVTKNGEKTSTIGITKGCKEDSPWRFQQQYGRFNAYVTEQAEKEIATMIVDKLNEDVLECAT